MLQDLQYDIMGALKRSDGLKGLIKVLVTDLSQKLTASVQIIDDKSAVILQTEAPNNSTKKQESIAFPLMLSQSQMGELKIYRASAFSEGELKYGELIASYLTLAILGADLSHTKSVGIKAALSALSYSELEGIINITSELSGTEGLLIASKIAEKHNLSRSGIVNGLRKLESAGLIETRSLGMKGTYIKILSEHLIVELSKFKGRQ